MRNVIRRTGQMWKLRVGFAVLILGFGVMSFGLKYPDEPYGIVFTMAGLVTEMWASFLTVGHLPLGAVCGPGDWLQPARFVKRPVGLAFSDRTKDHREVKVQYVVPPALRDRPIQLAVDDVHAMIRDTTKTIRKEFALEGRTFLGADAVCAVSPFDSPRRPRPKGKRVPTFAAGGDAELLKEGLKHVRAFRERHRDCIQRFLAGARDVVFPAGTYLMRVRFGVTCDDWSPPWCHAT